MLNKCIECTFLWPTGERTRENQSFRAAQGLGTQDPRNVPFLISGLTVLSDTLHPFRSRPDCLSANTILLLEPQGEKCLSSFPEQLERWLECVVQDAEGFGRQAIVLAHRPPQPMALPCSILPAPSSTRRGSGHVLGCSKADSTSNYACVPLGAQLRPWLTCHSGFGLLKLSKRVSKHRCSHTSPVHHPPCWGLGTAACPQSPTPTGSTAGTQSLLQNTELHH